MRKGNMNLIINYDTNEILYKTCKTSNGIKKDLENYYNNDINKLQKILINTDLDQIDIYNSFSIHLNKKVDGYNDEIEIFGDDGIVTLQIINVNKLDIF